MGRVVGADVKRDFPTEDGGRAVVGIIVGHATGTFGGIHEALSICVEGPGVLIVLASDPEPDPVTRRYDDATRDEFDIERVDLPRDERFDPIVGMERLPWLGPIVVDGAM
jgi:hypothetical protein